jgi:hypothetical protein
LSLVLLQNRFFIIRRGFALLDADSIGEAHGQAVAQAVAIVIADEACLAIYQRNCSLVTNLNAYAAACAFIFINGDNRS